MYPFPAVFIHLLPLQSLRLAHFLMQLQLFVGNRVERPHQSEEDILVKGWDKCISNLSVDKITHTAYMATLTYVSVKAHLSSWTKYIAWMLWFSLHVHIWE